MSAGAVLCTTIAATDKLSGAVTGAVPDVPRCLDYGRSFVRNTAAFNAVRMWIESRTTIIDTKSGSRTEYYQCGACKAENTFAERDLFKQDNYDFTPVFGGGWNLILRRHSSARPTYRQIRTQEDGWGVSELILPPPANITELDTRKKIWDAVVMGLPIVTQTELHNAETGLSAVIECPVKTMNVREKDLAYQTDTGPVCFPDLAKRHVPQIESLNLAYIAFNAEDFADFVVEAETPILADGKEVLSVYHYSKLVSLPAKNRVLAIGKL